MQRKFLSNLAFLLLVNLLIKPLWIFGVDRTVQNEVGADSYGLYFAIFNFSFIFSMLLDFGINNFNNRAIAQHEALLTKLLPSIFITKWLLALGYAIVTLITALALNFDSGQLHLLWFMVGNQVLISFTLYFRSNLAALHLFRLDALLSVLDKALMTVIIGTLLWGGVTSEPFAIEWLVYGQTTAYVLTAIIACAIVLAKARGLTFRWEPTAFKRIIRLSFPFALLGVLMSIYNRIDAVMIERMLGDRGDAEAGIYAASYRILDFFNMIGFAFASILLPMFARMIKQGQDVSKLLVISGRIILSMALIVSCACGFYAQELMQTLYVDATAYWARIFGLLMITFIPVSVAYVFGTLLTAKGNLRAMNLMAVGSVLLNVILNLVLIPEHEALGATIATVITQFLATIVQVILCVRSFRFAPSGGHLVTSLAFIAGTVVLFWLSTFIGVEWWLALGLAGALSLTLALVLKMIDLKAVRDRLEEVSVEESGGSP